MRSLKFSYISLFLILAAVYSEAAVKEFYFTMRHLSLINNASSGDDNGRVGRRPRGPQGTYSDETILFIQDISPIIGQKIDSVELSYYVTKDSIDFGNRTIFLYEQNRAPFSSTATYATYPPKNTPWDKLLDSATKPGQSTGWESFKSQAIANLVQAWADSVKENRGFVLAGEYGHWGWYMDISQAKMLVYYTPHKPVVAGSGTCLDFNGVDETVNVGNGGSLQLTNNFTLEAWIYPHSTSGIRRILGNSKTNAGIAFGIREGKPRFTTIGIKDYDGTADSIPVNTWTHLAVVFDGSNAATFFINGDSSQQITGNSPPTSSGNTMFIGKVGAGGEFFDGLIDEVRIWNKSLTQAEIQGNLYKPLSGSEAKLVGYWKMDEKSGTGVPDFSGGGNNGTTVNMGDVNWVPSSAWRNRTMLEDASIQIYPGYDPYGSAFTTTQSIAPKHGGLTFSNPSNPFTYTPDRNFAGRDTFRFKIAEGKFNDTFTIAMRVTNSNDTPVNIVLSKSTIAENMPAGSVVGVFSTVDPDSIVGDVFKDSLVHGTGSADISRFRISACTLYTAAVFNFEAQPALFIRVRSTDLGGLFIEKQCTLAVTNVNERPVAGSGRCLDFNGTDDCVYLGTGSAFQLTSGFTLEAWIYPHTVNGINRVLGSRKESKTDGIAFGLKDNKLKFSTCGIQDFDATTGAISANTWTHIAVVFDAAYDASFYVNGRFAEKIAGAAPPGTADIAMNIGQYGNGSEYFDGLIDEVRIWNDERTASEIAGSMYLSLKGTEANLAGYWRFDETMGTTAYDASPNKNHGALVNFAQQTWIKSAAWQSRNTNDTTAIFQSCGYDPDGDTISPVTYIWPKKGAITKDTSAKTIIYTPTVKSSGLDTGAYYLSDGKLADSFSVQVTITRVTQDPVITSRFPRDTAFLTGDNLTLTATATGIPQPTFEWFFYDSAATSVKSKVKDATLSITNLTTKDYGYYYVMAKNSSGSKSGDTVFVHVFSPITIDKDLPSQYTVPPGFTAQLNIETNKPGGRVLYQWYVDNSLLPNDTLKTIKIGPIDNTFNGKRYFCRVWNEYKAKVLSSDTSTVCMLVVSKYYNPFDVSVRKYNEQSVEIKISGDSVGIMNLQTIDPGGIQIPWSDSIWIVYKKNAFISDPGEGMVALFSTDSIKTSWPGPFIRKIPVDPLSSPDSIYCFSYTLKWREKGLTDTIIKPFKQAGTVNMLDTATVKNPLWALAYYFPRTDSALLIIDSLNKLSGSTDSLVKVQCSKDSGFVSFVFDTNIVVSLLAPNKKSDTLHVRHLGVMPIETDTVFYRWYVINKANIMSTKKKSDFLIGWDRPVFDGSFTADSLPTDETAIALRWNFNNTSFVPESIKIWYDTKTTNVTIGEFNANLPKTQSLYSANPDLRDTVASGLSAQTKYYFWIQVYKDRMWSRFVFAGFDSALTGHEDTTVLNNVINITSVQYDPGAHRIAANWTIDTTSLPPDRYYERGCVHSLDSDYVVTNKPTNWRRLKNGFNSDTIDLGEDIMFDTAYFMGLWLRGRNSSGKPTKAAPPQIGGGDTSLAWCFTGPFNWQVIRFSSVQKPDTDYAANKRIVVYTQQGKLFTYNDTLGAYHRKSSLPKGFVRVGGVPFYFTKGSPDILPFLMGIKYDSLPLGIAKSQVRLYRDVNDTLCVLYGSYERSGFIWDTLDRDDLKFPFMILADTAKPILVPAQYRDTIDTAVTSVVNTVTVKDNVGNVRYQYMFGDGSQGYPFIVYDTLRSGMNSITTIADNNNGSKIVHPEYGFRAQLTVSDGVNADTVNLSRCVRNRAGESFSIKKKQFAMVRTTLFLDYEDIDSVFNRSVENNKWIYDISRYRIFRYNPLPHNPLSSDTTDTTTWVEYADSLKKYYSFVPGRVLLIKTAQDINLKFGPGVTTSLKKSYIVACKPKTWTEFGLPYRFPVMLRDVLKTTGIPVAPKLCVYKWRRINNGYTWDAVFYGRDALVDTVTDTLSPVQSSSTYLVYNFSRGMVNLKIPPLCLPLSSTVRSYADTDDKGASSEVWNVQLLWRQQSGAGDYTAILLGYNSRMEETSFYGPLPPTMRRIYAGAVDTNRALLCGYGIQKSIVDGGMAYTVEFVNTNDTGVAVDYTFSHTEVLPQGFTIRVLNPQTLTFEEMNMNQAHMLSVEGNGSVRRVVVLGTDDYFSAVLKQLYPWNLQLVKAFPNPFRRMLRLYYTLPEGIAQVRFVLYDMRGRILWRGIEKKHLDKGIHVFTYDGTTGSSGRGYLSSGMYIMHMSAVNKSGTVIYGGKKKITCIR